MNVRDKIQACYDEGVAPSLEEAYYDLIDMGEIRERPSVLRWAKAGDATRRAHVHQVVADQGLTNVISQILGGRSPL